MTAVNVINVIFPYKTDGVWAFDDERVGLHRGNPSSRAQTCFWTRQRRKSLMQPTGFA
jgi:hypothetical protein